MQRALLVSFLCVFATFLNANLIPSKTRVLLQRRTPPSEFECSLPNGELRRFRDGSRWVVDQGGLETLENDLQVLVNCTEADDVLLLNLTIPFQPPRTIIIPWNLTISAFIDGRLTEDDTIVSSRRKVQLQCPQVDEGVFLIESRRSTLANLQFVNCTLNPIEGLESYGIVTLRNCSETRNRGRVNFHHVEFRNNVLNGSVAIEAESPFCSALELVDVRFRGNLCTGTCAARLSFRNELRQIRVTRNRQSDGLVVAPNLFLFPANSESTVDGLIASRNDGDILLGQSAEIRISNSRFSRNTGGEIEIGVFTGGITLINSIGRISDSEFELQSGATGSSVFALSSSLVINRTSFLRGNATAFGGQIALIDCQEVQIVDSVFSRSYAEINGGGIYSNNTASIQIRNSTFDRNSANRGGGIFASLGDLTIQNSRFSNNSVSADGAGFYVSDGSLEILQSSFSRNSADEFGGGGYTELCTYSIDGTEVVQNEALTGAGFAIYRSSGPINNSVFSNNSVDRFGGGLYIGASTFSNLVNCAFTGNSAQEGGGVYQDAVTIAGLISSQFQYNNASLSGGGASLGTGSYILNYTVFEENLSSEFGGGLTVYDSVLSLNGCRFLRNEAERSGAGINLYSETSASFFNSSWIGNRAAENGGGVLLEVGPQLLMESCILRSNRANSGAGIEAQDARLTILFSRFTRNRGRRFGSGISVRIGTGRISNSSFSRNSAEFGGALALTEFIGEISSCNFTRNEAQTDGGAFYSSSNTQLILQNCSFLMNSANDTGGAMVIRDSEISISNVLFGSNRAVGSGGGIFVDSSVELNLTNSSFQDSVSEFYGGAFATSEGTVLQAGNLSIESCSAARGGGIYLYRTTGNLTESQIFNNDVSEIGGGIAVIESSLQIREVNVSMNTALGTVDTDAKGGGIIIQTGSIFDFRNLTLIQNRGAFGAGIFIGDFSQGSITGFSAFNNSAFVSGGAVYLDSSNLSLHSGAFLENSAFYGGALYATNATLVLLESSLINSSSTDAGGGILAQEGSFVTLENTNLESNSAVNGGGIMLVQSYFWGIRVQFLDCQARVHGGGVGLNETSSFLCSNCLFTGNSAVEEGGAIRLDSPDPQLLAFQLEDSEFDSNHAAFGGGVHFRTGNGSADCSDPNSNSCTFLAMTGCSFHDNHADFTGGAILANDPYAIRISCQSIQKQDDPFSFFSRQEFSELTEFGELDVACEDWKDSNSADSYGPMIGSYARSLSKSVFFEQDSTEIEIPENRYVLRDHASGVPLPTILLEAVDAFNQGPALIQGNELMEAVMTSPDGLFAGTFTVLMENSKGNFTGVTGFKEPGNYDVRIDFSEESIPTLIIVVEIRRCRIGESKTVNGTFCERCRGDTYNFSPENEDSQCLPCPEDAHCDSVAIRPKKGFWHQMPCSNHTQRCLSERACDEQDRDARLMELGSSIEDCDFDDEFIGRYSEALCREGYSGPLCGSCQASFGKSRSFRCEKCYGRFANLLLVFLTALVLLGLTGFAIKSNLPSRRPVVVVVVASQAASRRAIETTEHDPPVNFQMVEMMHTGIVPKEIIHPHLRQNQQPNAARTRQSPNRELMKWKTVEVFKITVNYLQVIAIAIAVNVDWTNALILVFEATEFIGGVTSEAATRSTDCLISDDSSVPRSAVRTIVNFIVPGVVGAFFAIFWAVSMIKNRHGYNYLVKRCILSALALGYLSYIAITKTSVNILYCIEVHDSVDFEDDSTTRYWAVDTALKCYKGPHTVLASVFGFPVLVLFSLGFPVLVAYVLIMKRSKEGIQSPWLFETAGFLYRSYNPRYIFWESVILLRKAVLAVVVVFAYPLGGNLQGILAVCVLMIALYFHIICSPYRSEFDQLNKLEGLSLLISSLTFVSGLFFNDDRTSTEVRAFISVCLILANVGIFMYFLIVFLAAGAQYLKAVLEAEDVVHDQNGGTIYIYKIYLKTRMEQHLEFFARQFSTNRQNQIARSSEV